MNQPLVCDHLWEAIESLLPEEPPKRTGGRPCIPGRAALAGIVFVLRTGCPWQSLPADLLLGLLQLACALLCVRFLRPAAAKRAPLGSSGLEPHPATSARTAARTSAFLTMASSFHGVPRSGRRGQTPRIVDPGEGLR